MSSSPLRESDSRPEINPILLRGNHRNGFSPNDEFHIFRGLSGVPTARRAAGKLPGWSHGHALVQPWPAASIVSKLGVARLALFKRQIIFDGPLYACSEFLPTFWRVQSTLARQNMSRKLAAFFCKLRNHSKLRRKLISEEQ